MTAFYTKQNLSSKRTEQAIQTFFSIRLGYFIGKHTDWLLLNEPETSLISPAVLNQTKNDLLSLYRSEIIKSRYKEEKQGIFHVDLNEIVAKLSEENPDVIVIKKGRRKKNPIPINAEDTKVQRQASQESILGKRKRDQEFDTDLEK